MEDFIFAPIVLVVGLGIHQALIQGYRDWEARLFGIAFFAHMVSAVVQVLLVKYYFQGGGDMLGYYEYGVQAADLLRADFTRFAPELVRAFFQSASTELPIDLYGGGATQSMSAAAGFILFITGNSLYAASLLVALAAYMSQVLLYRALKSEFPAMHHRALLLGTNLLPSAVFWSSALLKEPLVMATLGPIVLGLKWVSDGRRYVLATLMLLPALAIAATIKPYVLMALSVAAGVYLLWKRLQSRSAAALKPFWVVMALAVGGGGLVLGNNYFTKEDTSSAAEALARQRSAGVGIEGGSNFQLQNSEGQDFQRRTIVEELLLAPLGLVTALFRPFIFEARNVVQLLNAVEATVLLWLFLRSVRRLRFERVLGIFTGSPALLFCLVFTLALALGTGLSTSNMGTLSRYRAPMMPFFFTILLVLDRTSATVRRNRELSPAAATQ